MTRAKLCAECLVRSLGRFDLDPCGHPGWKTADHLICLPGSLVTCWRQEAS